MLDAGAYMQFTYVNPEEEEGEVGGEEGEGEGDEEEGGTEGTTEEKAEEKEGETKEEGEEGEEGEAEGDDGTRRRENANLKVVIVKEEGLPAFSNIFLIGK